MSVTGTGAKITDTLKMPTYVAGNLAVICCSFVVIVAMTLLKNKLPCSIVNLFEEVTLKPKLILTDFTLFIVIEKKS